MGLKGRFGGRSSRRSPKQKFAWGQREWVVDGYSGSIDPGQVVTVSSATGDGTVVAGTTAPTGIGARGQLLRIGGDLRIYNTRVGGTSRVNVLHSYVWLRRQIAEASALSGTLYSFINSPGDSLAGRGDVMMYGTVICSGYANSQQQQGTDAAGTWGGNVFKAARIPTPRPRGLKLDAESSELVCIVSPPIDMDTGQVLSAAVNISKVHNALRYLYGK